MGSGSGGWGGEKSFGERGERVHLTGEGEGEGEEKEGGGGGGVRGKGSVVGDGIFGGVRLFGEDWG